MSTGDDADLRGRFRELREHDCAVAPAFENVLLHAPARVLRRRQDLAWTAGGFALAAAVGLFLFFRPLPTALDVVATALPPWQSPTDFLLAGADDSLQRLSWTSSPTVGLGQPGFIHIQEDL